MSAGGGKIGFHAPETCRASAPQRRPFPSPETTFVRKYESTFVRSSSIRPIASSSSAAAARRARRDADSLVVVVVPARRGPPRRARARPRAPGPQARARGPHRLLLQARSIHTGPHTTPSAW
eukprot:15366-Pelagococcus_subviridis.AAC.1